MGCGVSKPEDGVGSGAAGRPIYRRFDEIKRLRLGGSRPRKGSTVSNVGLLNPEEEDDDSAGGGTEEVSPGEITSGRAVCSSCGARFAPPVESSGKNQLLPLATEAEVVAPDTSTAAPDLSLKKNGEKHDGEENLMEVNPGVTKETAEKVDEHEDKQGKDISEGANDADKEQKENNGGKDDVSGAALVRGGGPALTSDDEELPGSPSFRVYFVGSAGEATDEESHDATIINLGKTEEIGSRRRYSMDSSNSEEREAKTSPKPKGGKLRALTRRHSAVHVLLNVRSCYDQHHGDASAGRGNSTS